MLMAVIVTAGGCGGDSNTIPSLPPDKAVGTGVSPASQAPTQSEPEMVVDRYLQALGGGDETACNELTASLVGRIARANHNTYDRPDINLILCRTHARDLSKQVSVSVNTVSLGQMNGTTATVNADVALEKSYADGSPSDASSSSTYTLIRQRGRWRINDIVERSYTDTLVNEVGGPVSTDLPHDLVLIRGCSAKSYCEPLLR
jgi:hypothetical protein